MCFDMAGRHGRHLPPAWSGLLGGHGSGLVTQPTFPSFIAVHYRLAGNSRLTLHALRGECKTSKAECRASRSRWSCCWRLCCRQREVRPSEAAAPPTTAAAARPPLVPPSPPPPTFRVPPNRRRPWAHCEVHLYPLLTSLPMAGDLVSTASYTCDPSTCLPPACMCAANNPPGGLTSAQMPQFILVSSSQCDYARRPSRPSVASS